VIPNIEIHEHQISSLGCRSKHNGEICADIDFVVLFGIVSFIVIKEA